MIELSELRRLLEAATKGTWHLMPLPERTGGTYYVSNMERTICDDSLGTVSLSLEDARLLVAMRNKLPEMLDKLAAAEALYVKVLSSKLPEFDAVIKAYEDTDQPKRRNYICRTSL
jgi:hypothetical protein